MKVRKRKVGLGFWFLWVLATTLGMPLGFLLCFFLLGAFPFSIWGIMIGATVGTLQWVVLRRCISGAGLWIAASAAGFALATYIMDFKSFEDHMHMGKAVLSGGIATSILQWLILRSGITRASWWILACSIGCLVGFILEEAFFLGVDPSLYGMAVFGAVPGAITGSTLIWLLRNPLPRAQSVTGN